MVIGYTILINQLVFHFLDVYIPMLHPLFFADLPRSFVAPTALTVFTGSQEAPTPLCSINLEAKQGAVRSGCYGFHWKTSGEEKTFFPGKHQEHLGRLGDFSPSNTGV